MFEGAATALITPFTETGVDYGSLEKLIETQIAGGIDALVICGTTGEPATMTADERAEVIACTVETVNRRVPVIVGSGSNCTANAVQNSIAAQKAGADALLVVTPYYNKCTQDGLYLHYKAVCDAVGIPVIAYNVPGRTGVNILPETAARLSGLDLLRGLKEASGKLDQIAQTARLLRGSNVTLYSGDDSLTTQLIEMGAKGVISVASNLVPSLIHELAAMGLQGNGDAAKALQESYVPLFGALFCEVNPIPIKYACSRVGLCRNVLRLPLTPITAQGAEKVDAALQSLGLI